MLSQMARLHGLYWGVGSLLCAVATCLPSLQACGCSTGCVFAVYSAALLAKEGAHKCLGMLPLKLFFCQRRSGKHIWVFLEAWSFFWSIELYNKLWMNLLHSGNYRGGSAWPLSVPGSHSPHTTGKDGSLFHPRVPFPQSANTTIKFFQRCK